MTFKIILIESDSEMLDEMLGNLRRSLDFIIMATYSEARIALNQVPLFRPDIIFFSVDDVSSITLIRRFVDAFEGVMVLGMLQRWNTNIAQKCVENGARGCILKSFTVKDVLESIKIYKSRENFPSSKVLSFFSAKGNDGRTTIASTVAIKIAQKTNKSVALIDADLQFGDVASFFNVIPKRNIIDAVQDVSILMPLTLKSYFYELKENVSLLCGATNPEFAELASLKNIIEVINLTKLLFSYVIIDLPCGINPISLGICEISDKIFITTKLGNSFKILHSKRALDFFRESAILSSKKLRMLFVRNKDSERALEQVVASEFPAVKCLFLANDDKISSSVNSDLFLERVTLLKSFTDYTMNEMVS